MRKTTRFKQLIVAPELLMMPGVHDALSARIAESAGFDANHVAQMQQTVAGSNLSARYVGENPAETDGDQQQRLEFARDREIQQQQPDTEHQQLAPGKLIQAGAFPDLAGQFHESGDRY